MIKYNKMKAEEIRNELRDLGLAEDIIQALKGKTALVNKHREILEDMQNMVEKSTEQLKNLKLEEEADQSVPDMPEKIEYGDENWSQYVMDYFKSGEIDDKGHPKLHGLRRVVHQLLGPVVFSGPVNLYPSNDGDGIGRASAIVEIVIMWGGDLKDLRTFRGAASSWHGNTDDKFAIYPEAMAETRAEARALRKALGLHEVSSDELTEKDATEIVEQYKSVKEWGDDVNAKITDNQIRGIQTICERLNIDVVKFINSGQSSYNAIEEVTRITAAKMIQKLNNYQTNLEVIPNEILKE